MEGNDAREGLAQRGRPSHRFWLKRVLRVSKFMALREEGSADQRLNKHRQGRSHELAGGRIDVSVDAVQAGAVPIRTFWL